MPFLCLSIFPLFAQLMPLYVGTNLISGFHLFHITNIKGWLDRCTIESSLLHHTRKAESENYYGYHATQQRILSLLKDLVLAGRALEHSVSQGIDPFS